MCSTDLAVLDGRFSTTNFERKRVGSEREASPILQAETMPPAPVMTASCVCGRVKLKASGSPIISATCYCNDCQNGAAQIEALPHAPAVRDPDGGSSYILYRKDRFECTDGAELLRSFKLKETSPTNRVAATCCNSALFMNFDRGPHWVSVYRSHVTANFRPFGPGSSPDPGLKAPSLRTTCPTTRASHRASSSR